MLKRRINKKAVFFSLDALIALSIIIVSIFVIYPIIRYSEKQSYVPEDIILSLSALKIGDINSSYVSQLIAGGNITNLNKSILEQIGEFYVDDSTKPIAEELARQALLTIKTTENIGIWYDDFLLASRNKTSWEESKDRTVERHIISGIKEGEKITGYSARAFLSNNEQIKYYYFGGYVGDGNITLNLEYNGSLKHINLEVTANKNFLIYANDEKLPGVFQAVASEFEPKNFPLDAYISEFESGSNEFKIVPENKTDSIYIAGGYLKLTYEDGVQYKQPEKYYFPGIEGIINLYDGFYIPGQLNELEIFLHFNSNNTLSLTIGNVTVFNQSSNGETSETISNATLGNKLKYADLVNKNTPVRLRLENISQIPVASGGNADIILVTDLSGSMDWGLDGGSSGITRSCNSPHLYDPDTKRISVIKCLSKNFTEKILSIPGNRIGLATFSKNGNVPIGYNLSSDLTLLKASIDSYDPSGSTCACCGLNYAFNILNASSNSSRKKFIVIMSDGEANERCTSASSCPPDNSRCDNDIWWGWGGCSPGPEVCFAGTGVSGSSCCTNYDEITAPGKNAIWSAERANNLLQANISSIGFFTSPSIAGNTTLSEIARVGGGMYRLGTNAYELLEAYMEIAESISAMSYFEQTSVVIGNITSVLYPDSFIKFDYIKEKTPYGLIITEEKIFTDIYSGSFIVPSDSEILETKVISYSGPRWTKEVSISHVNNTVVYNLTKYGSDYTKLGDPYAINIPNSAVGNSNTIRLTTGISPANTSAGSSFNKIIYTILKNMESYSAISYSAEGCIWEIEFEDETTLIAPLPATATDTCYYTSTSHASPVSGDALKTAVYNLFKKLDLDNDGRLEVKFAEQNLQLSSSEIIGIPYQWETVVQVRKWW